MSMINAIHRYGNYTGEQWAVAGPAVKAEAAPEAASKEEKAEKVDYRSAVKTGLLLEIFDEIYSGEHGMIKELVEKALKEEYDPLEIINDAMTPAIKAVGDGFSTGELFLPDLILAAETMQEAMGVITPLVEGNKDFKAKGKVVIGTVKGDLHDIGKNMVKALLKGNGFEVIDLGVNNSPENFVKAVKENNPDVVGYSGLLTTTLAAIPEQLGALKEAGLRDKVLTIVGGAPVTEEFARRNGADLYGKDANEAVKVIEKALEGKKIS